MPKTQDLQCQMRAALDENRKSKSRNDTKRALIGVFVVIPGAVLLAILLFLGSALVL